MAEQKTRPGNGDVAAFLEGIEDEAKRADSRRLIDILSAETGAPAVLWGSMVGFGHYRYRYESGHEGEAFLVGFAPRKAEFSLYLMGCNFPDTEAARDALLARLGKYRMGKACLYVKRLSDIDEEVLRALAALSIARLRSAYP